MHGSAWHRLCVTVMSIVNKHHICSFYPRYRMYLPRKITQILGASHAPTRKQGHVPLPPWVIVESWGSHLCDCGWHHDLSMGGIMTASSPGCWGYYAPLHGTDERNVKEETWFCWFLFTDMCWIVGPPFYGNPIDTIYNLHCGRETVHFTRQFFI